MESVRTPSTMKSWQYASTKGGLEKNLKLNHSAPLPTPKPSEHLVRVTAVALNPVDYKPAEVALVHRFLMSKPATPGIDFAGSIIIPAAGSSFKPGQAVFGVAGTTPFAGGALREYATVEDGSLAAIPDVVSPVDAATIGVAGLTAYQSILPKIKKGDSILINGGSGGTGVFGIQFAKVAGCHVTTTCSTGNVELCKDLGADEVIDYKKQDLVKALKASGPRFDHVIDNVGANSQLYWHGHEYMKEKASYVMVAGLPTLDFLFESLKRKFWPGFLGGGKRKCEGFFPKQNHEDLRQIGQWMEEGKVKSVIDQRFSFEDAPKAFKKLKTGRARGKIVIDVIPEHATT